MSWNQSPRVTQAKSMPAFLLLATLLCLITGCSNRELQIEASLAEALRERDAARADLAALRRDWYTKNIDFAQTASRERDKRRTLESLEAAPAEHRGWEWWWLKSSQENSLYKLASESGRVFLTIYSPRHNRILLGFEEGHVKIVNTDTGDTEAELRGHAGSILDASFSHDGLRVVTTGPDSTIVWYLPAGKKIAEFEGRIEQLITSVDLSPDGEFLATASYDAIALWAISTQHKVYEVESNAQTVAFSPDGSRILVNEGYSCTIRSVEDGEVLLELLGHKDSISSASFNADGSRILTASYDGTAIIWNATTAEQIFVFSGHAAALLSASFDRSETKVVTTSSDRTARVWNTQNGRLIATISGHTDRVISASFSRDGHRVVTVSADRTAKVSRAATGKLECELHGHTDQVFAAMFSASGDRVFTASHDGTVRVWECMSEQPTHYAFRHDNEVRYAVPSPDGSLIAVLGSFPSLNVWDLRTAKPVGRINHAEDIRRVSFSPYGSRLITVSSDGAARVWAVPPRELILELPSGDSKVLSAQMSPDGSRILTASKDHVARVWNAITGSLLSELDGHPASLLDATYNKNGELIATGCIDGIARVWNARSGELISQTYQKGGTITHVQFSPTNNHLLTLGNGGIILWDISTKDAKLLFTTGNPFTRSVSFSPDGKRIASDSDSKVISVWDATTGALLVSIEGHDKHVRSVAFSRDGTRIISASVDQTIRVWDAVPYGVRHAEREANSRGEDGGAIVRAWLDEVGWKPH